MPGRVVTFDVEGVPAGSGVTDAQGKTSLRFTVPGSMGVGVYDVTATHEQDAEYNAATRTTAALAVTLPKANVAFSQYMASGMPAQTVTLKTLVLSGGSSVSGLPIKFAVDGVAAGTETSDASGASLAYTIPATMTYGSHNVTVSFAGSASYNAAARTTAALNVQQRILFSQYASTGAPGDTVTLRTMVLCGGLAVSGLPITFAVDGLTAGTATSDASGAALAYKVPTTVAAGSHGVTVSFAGNGTYAPASRSTDARTVGTPRANVTFSLCGASGSVGQTVTLRTLVLSGGVALIGKTIGFAVDGTPAGSATSDPSGASLNYMIPVSLSAGTHNLTVSFAGDNGYNAATRTTAALTVK